LFGKGDSLVFSSAEDFKKYLEGEFFPKSKKEEEIDDHAEGND
jgi:hypothetical protein